MMFLIRVTVGGLFLYVFYRGFFQSGPLDGVEVALLMFCLWLGGLVVSILWAPVIGDELSDPLTAALTDGTTLPPTTDTLVRAIRRLQYRGWHRLALALCFLEGMRYPDLPHPPLLALRSARPGSRLEKWMAQEVYQYNNVKNCVFAYQILTERHHAVPPNHAVPEVNLAIIGLNRPPPPPAPALEVPRRPPPVKPQRNPNIRLFGD